MVQGGLKQVQGGLSPPWHPTSRAYGRRGRCPGARGSELSGLECKIHQLKLRPADAMMFFFDFGPKFEHLRRL